VRERGLFVFQVDAENLLVRPVSSATSPGNVHNTLSHLRSSITKRIQLRRSMRNSSTSAGTLPTPDSAAAASDATDSEYNREHYVSVPHQTNSQRSADGSLESNSTDAIAARYADHCVPHPPADNHSTTADRVCLARFQYYTVVHKNVPQNVFAKY